nr:o-succinylbenzoate synthase [Deinococcus sp.]
MFLLKLPLKFRFETSFGVQTARTVPLIVLHGANGEVGLGEGVMEDAPMFREETVTGALYLLKELFLPAVLGQSFVNPQSMMLKLSGFRGNPMAKAMLEAAAWDLWARTLGVPLARLLGGVRTQVAVGVSLGIQESEAATVQAVETHLGQGYRRIKLKIKPGWDVQPVRAVRTAFPDIALTVDANSAYTLEHTRTFQNLDAYGLDYIEQPLAYDDLLDHAALQRRIATPLCLDECIVSAETARKALGLDAGRVINVKQGRVGGVAESLRLHDVAQAFSVPLWCGGMLESGVGRALNIHLSTLPGFTKPGDTASASRYWERDVINEPLEMVGGYQQVPMGPGLGVTLNREFVESVASEHWTTEAGH